MQKRKSRCWKKEQPDEKYLESYFFVGLIAACKNSENDNNDFPKNKWKILRSDTMNLVTMADTMIIFEGACRGCEYEGTISFSVVDSMEIVELSRVETYDDNPSDMAGGSVNKNLILVPKKTGNTIIKVCKFLTQPISKEDSSDCTNYSIEVRN